jgi:hypothetical protein
MNLPLNSATNSPNANPGRNCKLRKDDTSPPVRQHRFWPPFGFMPNGVELKAERRKPSGEKHCDIEDIPSLTGVLAHFRLH